MVMGNLGAINSKGGELRVSEENRDGYISLFLHPQGEKLVFR